MAEVEEEQVEQESGESARAKLKTMLMIAVGAILIATLSVAGTWFLLSREDNPADEDMAEEMAGEEGEGAAEAPRGPALYLAMEPAFIVNFMTGARTRFLQLELSLVSRNSVAIDAANTHMPLIRNNFLEVLARQDYQALQTVAGKEQLVKELTEAAQAIMQEKIGQPGIETVLFRSFVMQ